MWSLAGVFRSELSTDSSTLLRSEFIGCDGPIRRSQPLAMGGLSRLIRVQQPVFPEPAVMQLKPGLIELAVFFSDGCVSRYATRARRLSLDLKQRREERMLSLKHELENIVLEIDGLPSRNVEAVLDEMLPPPAVIGVIEGPRMNPSPSLTVNNFNPQFINELKGAVVQNIAVLDHGVLEPFRLVSDRESALDAYIASYVWGYAQANFGPYRAERVIRLNTLENGTNFAADLHELAGIAMTDGGIAAFQHIVGKRQDNRKFFDQWGPAFATKFISFATKASDQVPTTTIMDSIVVGFFRNHCEEIGPLWLNWNSAGSYRRYTECIAEWAQDLGIEPEQVEQLIFGEDVPPVSDL